MSVRIPVLRYRPDYSSHGNAFNGEVKGVLLSIADDPNNSDYLVNPEDGPQRQAQVPATTGAASRTSLLRPGPAPSGAAPGAHGVRLRRRRHGQGRQGNPVTRTARRSARGRSGRRWRSSSPPTTVAMSARIRAPRFRRTTARWATPSTARLRACSSRLRMTRTITWLTPRTPSGRPWGGSKRRFVREPRGLLG